MSKRRELEQEIEQLKEQAHSLNTQIQTLNGQIQSLNKQVDSYRSQEQAIVQALTHAQSSAAKHIEEAKASAAQIVGQANEQSERTLQETEAQKERMLSEAASALQEANDRAAAIVEAAQADSSRRLAQTEASVKEFQGRILSLSAILKRTAEDALEHTREYTAAIEALGQEPEELLAESRGISAMIDERADNAPMDYSTPQELMHSIYQLQGRDLPAEAADEQGEEAVIEEPAQETVAQEQPKMAAAEPEPVPASNPEKPAPVQEPEERMWTVNEIMNKGMQSPVKLHEEPDVDLDSLLDEIIGD